ncbi:MAG: dihydroorotase [Trueperaceae bacterium]|nr:dihydroorotase [Trueperaceae bacterium]
MSRIVIRNARLYDPEYDLKYDVGEGSSPPHPNDPTNNTATNTADLYLNDGIIEGVNLGGDVDESFDAGGNLVTPAFVDLHAHLREPGQEVKENLASGLAAAAAGGYGTVVSMANTTPVITEPEQIAELIAKAERLGQARLRPAAALSHGLKGERLTDFAALQDAGAVMITDDGIPVRDAHLMRRACEYAAELGLVIQTHSEEPSLRQDGVMNEGTVSQRIGLPGNPVAAEAVMIYRDCEIAHLTGARVHIAHVSSARGWAVVERFKEQGAPVSGEVTPHHLTLTDEAMAAFDPVYKVAPPLRSAADVAFLRDALARGVVDSIGTDHAPHTRAEKDRDMLDAPFGIGNIEVAFPLLYSELVTTDVVTLAELLRRLQRGPTDVMDWSRPNLDPGSPADVVVLDLGTSRPVRPETFKSKATFSPWAQQTLRGWPVATFVRGRKVYEREGSS